MFVLGVQFLISEAPEDRILLVAGLLLTDDLGVTWRSMRTEGADWRVTGADWRATGADWRVTGADWRATGADWRLTGADWRVTGADWRVTGADWRVTGADWRVTGADWRATGADSRLWIMRELSARSFREEFLASAAWAAHATPHVVSPTANEISISHVWRSFD